MVTKASKTIPDFQIETDLITRGLGPVCGIDEAGRGPWSGPVVAAAVILRPDIIPLGINDSKKLTHKKREMLFDTIYQVAQVGVGIVDVDEIDRINILQATFKAMREAVGNLDTAPAVALIDGTGKPGLTCDMQTFTKGDQRSFSIAAASIIAKVTRDRIMEELGKHYPCYGWERNKGYGTAAHLSGLKSHGVSRHHRKSFKPIRKLIESAKERDLKT